MGLHDMVRLLLGASGLASAVLVFRLLRQQAPRCATPVADVLAIVVPGGGLTLEGKPLAWVRERLREAARLYKERKAAGEPCIIATLSGGTPHKPMPLDPQSHFQVYEAEGNARCLIRDFGVAPEDVFEENWSLDTIANAYMLRTVHTDVVGWRRMVIVNNAYHMPRTRAIFDAMFALEPVCGKYELSYVEVSNDGVPHDTLEARQKREAKSLEGFRKTIAGIQTMSQMHSFLFRDHLAYASKRLVKDREPVDSAVLGSY